MKDYIVKELEQRISSFQQLPYLFVGTGFSMRYSHAPSWNTLLFDIWTVINPTKKERDFNKLKQKIEMDIASTKPDLNAEEQKYYVNPILASVIEKEFNDRYYSDDGFDINVFREDENDDIITLSNTYTTTTQKTRTVLNNVSNVLNADGINEGAVTSEYSYNIYGSPISQKDSYLSLIHI